MRRFYRNRWWTFVLALCLGLAAPLFPISPASANDPIDLNDGHLPDDPPTASGDPDKPQGPRAAKPSRGASRESYGVRPAGGGTYAVQSELRMRIRSVLLLLKVHYLRD
jgi:hypothetical protein